jgi:hypothetical protein
VVVPAKVAEFCPAAKDTEEGTVRLGLLDSRDTVTADAGAWVSVIVQVVVGEAGAMIAAGEQAIDDSRTCISKV